MSEAYRVLRVTFETPDALESEFVSNLAKGGLFLPGHLELLYGEPVMVLVDLPFAETAIEVEGRVVQTIPVEFEANGAQSGVALELNEPPARLRERFEAATGVRLPAEDDSDGQRRSARAVAHVRALGGA